MNWIILILLLVLVWVVVTFNRLVVLRNRTRNQWAQVESELKRRFDLISRLVTVMQGHQIYEANTLTAVVEERRLAHEGGDVGEVNRTESTLRETVKTIFGLVENYPVLKTNRLALNLQKELIDTEDRIRFARQFYNDTVMKYNNWRQMFPASLVAERMGFEEGIYFDDGNNEKE